MVSYLWALLAALNVTVCETFFASRGSYWKDLWLYTPMALLTNYCIYRLVRSAPTLVDGLIIFSLGTLVLRTTSAVFVLHQRLSPGTWCGLALVGLANVIRYAWR